jgi:hypothetical protein
MFQKKLKETNSPRVTASSLSMKKTLGRGNSFMTSKNETNSDTEILSNKKKPSVDRVVLSTEAAAKLDSWITRITGTRHGVELSRRDVVDWLITTHMAANLSPSEEKELADLHYDEVKFLHYAIQELKSAQGRGESISLQDLIVRVQTAPKIQRTKKKSKETVAVEIEGELKKQSNAEEQISYEKQ